MHLRRAVCHRARSDAIHVHHAPPSMLKQNFGTRKTGLHKTVRPLLSDPPSAIAASSPPSQTLPNRYKIPHLSSSHLHKPMRCSQKSHPLHPIPKIPSHSQPSSSAFRLPPSAFPPAMITKNLSNSSCETPNHQRKTTIMNTPSLRLRPLAAAILCSLIAPALFAQTATTTPVGFVTVTIPAATDASTPSNTVVSVPLYGTADYVSTVATIDSTTQFTMTGAAWIAGAYANASAPRLVRVKTSTTAAHVGRFFLISGNTVNQLTVTLPVTVTDVATTLSVGDSCEIVPANTLGSVFGTAATPPTLTGGTSPNVADNVLIFDGTTWQTYFWTGATGSPVNIWKKTGPLDRSSTVIFPDEAVFVIRRDITAAATVTLMGTVPSTAEQTDIAAAGSTFLSNRFPVDATLGGLGLQSLPSWVAGASPTTADNVLIFDGTTWQTYFWTGAVGSPVNIWKKTGPLDRSSTPIPTGTGVFIIHAGAAAALTQTLPYVP